MKPLLAALVAIPLAACVTGRAEIAAMPGVDASPTALARAQAKCRNAAEDYADRQIALYGGFVVQNNIIDYSERCLAAEGFAVKGYRQPDGTMTARPWGSIAQATQRAKQP